MDTHDGFQTAFSVLKKRYLLMTIVDQVLKYFHHYLTLLGLSLWI